MLNDLLDPAATIRVSGHETFSLRLLWLKKAFDVASGPDGVDRRTFQEQNAIATFGVGKNMALSMRHWALATNVLRDGPSSLTPSDFGRLIFSDGEGLDPYLEHPSTLWQLHAHLVSEPAVATTFYYAFNHLNQIAFTRDDLVRAMAAVVKARASTRATAETLKRDVEVFVRSYAPRYADGGEDAAEPLLVELGLLRENRATGQLEFVRGPKTSLDDSIFALALKRFWQRQHPQSPTISVEQVQYDAGSPGRIFKLDEDSLVARLMNIGDVTSGKMVWSDTAGLRQVALNGGFEDIDDIALITAGYGRRKRRMTKLAEIVKVERRFALSARIDTDLNGTPPLTGYVLQASVRKSLEAMLAGIADGSQYAFTWTGPYGGGKSCAALLVANLVAGNTKQRALAETIVGGELARAFSTAFPRRERTWEVVALTGRRTDLSGALAEAASKAFSWPQSTLDAAQDDQVLIDALEARARSKGGMLIVIDELGKFLEHATSSLGDVHILQDLAERAARSEGRLVIVGILHQSFEQYSGRLGRTGRNEWAKVQGRYQNVPFIAQADEVAALIAAAIGTNNTPASAGTIAQRTAQAISHRRPVDVAGLADVLTQAWPLHPVSTLLLGPVSRQRFAQNERSVFGFLSSSEPSGFQAHLARTDVGENSWYGPDQLWDYLVANFGSALSVGPESNRMTLAMEAVEKAALYGALTAKLAKSAAVIELFRNGSGLAVGDDILALCAPEATSAEIAAAIDELVNRAIFIRQSRLGGYALFAGSDFDLDEAISKVALKLDADILTDLPSRLGVGPIAAKSHYFATGALRTFDVVIQFADDSPQSPAAWAKKTAAALARTPRRSSGLLIMLLPDPQTFEASIKVAAKQLSIELESLGILAGIAANEKVYLLRDHASDLYALDRIEQSHPQLEGDRIARRELSARKAQIAEIVRSDLLSAFSGARWWAFGESAKDASGKKLESAELTVIASALSRVAYASAPTIQSELLYRDKPSSAAMAGLRSLVHAMVSKADMPDLGIENYPVERGLYLTIIQPLGLHRQDEKGVWRFADPDEHAGATLAPAWSELAEKRVNLAELFGTWAGRPYGLKRGVMPVLALSYMLAHRSSVAVYVDGVFQPAIDDVVADRLLQDPAAIEFRRISRSKRDEAFVRQLAALLSTEARQIEAQALPVASSLYQRFHSLPQWAQRTQSLDAKIRKVRDIVLKASDPEALLFSDLAAALDGDPDPAVTVVTALKSAESAYPQMLDGLRASLAAHLGVDPKSFDGIGPRSAAASGVSAELRVDAFIMRAGAFQGPEGDIEGLASLLVHKPPKNWSDREHEQAMFELAKLSLKFREAETFATVRGRSPTSQAISVMVGLNPNERPLFHSFQVSDNELAVADRAADELIAQLRGKGMKPLVELAALARIFERLSSSQEVEPT